MSHMVFQYSGARLFQRVFLPTLGAAVFCTAALFFLSELFFPSGKIVGNRFASALWTLMVCVAAVASLVVSISNFRARRPIKISDRNISCIGWSGEPVVTIDWREIDQIDRRLFYEELTETARSQFEVYGGKNVVRFDSSIQNFDELLSLLNSKIEEYGIKAAIVETPGFLRKQATIEGITSPEERRDALRRGRRTSVVRFGSLGSE